MQTSISIKINILPDYTDHQYDLSWKGMGEKWDDAKRAVLDNLERKPHLEYTIEALDPQSTYAIRIAVLAKDGSSGPPGEEAVIDTDAVSCSPKPSKRCACTIS